jgi:hypothetical protein
MFSLFFYSYTFNSDSLSLSLRLQRVNEWKERVDEREIREETNTEGYEKETETEWWEETKKKSNESQRNIEVSVTGGDFNQPKLKWLDKFS